MYIYIYYNEFYATFSIYLICDDTIIYFSNLFSPYNHDCTKPSIKCILFFLPRICEHSAIEVSAEIRCRTSLARNFEHRSARWGTRWRWGERGDGLAAFNKAFRRSPRGPFCVQWGIQKIPRRNGESACIALGRSISRHIRIEREIEMYSRKKERGGRVTGKSNVLIGNGELRRKKFRRGCETYDDWSPRSCEERSNKGNLDTADQSRVVFSMAQRETRYFFTL